MVIFFHCFSLCSVLDESVSLLRQLFFDYTFVGATVLLLRVHAPFQRAVTHVISTPDFLLIDVSNPNYAAQTFVIGWSFFISYALLVFVRV